MSETATGPQSCDLLVTHIDWLITVDPQRRVIRDAALAVKDGRFVEVGKTADLSARWQAAQVVQARGSVVTPGLIDNHLHAPQSAHVVPGEESRPAGVTHARS